MDWKFAFERSEMLRLLQSQLLQSIAHELKTPINGQVGSLELILGDLCDSPAEEREYVQAARQGVDRSLALLQEFSQMAKYHLPVQALQPQRIPVGPVLRDVQMLTRLPAQDRGIRYHWPALDNEGREVTADAAGLTQALWGLCHWGIGCLRYGTLEIQMDWVRASGDLSSPWVWRLDIQGQPLQTLDPSQMPDLEVFWRVSGKILAAMGGECRFEERDPRHVGIEVRLP